MDNNQFLLEMGAKVRAVRKERGLSLRGLAALVKMTPTAICDLELGRKNSLILTLNSLAEILEVDVKEFL